MATSILLVDDHVLLLDTLKEYLVRSLQGVQVDAVRTLAECEARLREPDPPDLALVDYRMPGGHGLATIRELVANEAEVPIAVMSGQATPGEVMALLRLGTMGFVSKSVSGTSLTHAVRLMLSGERYLPASVFADAQPRRSGVAALDEEAPVTLRELEVLRLLRSGLTNKEIGRALMIEEVTVKLHINRLCKRLGVKNRVQVLMAAMERSLLD